MIVYLFSFNKRENSTKIPTAGTGTLISNVQLKDDTSVVNPILLFTPAITESPVFLPTQFNYAHIPQWGRYYYITDWTYKKGIWECALSVDVLASFKMSIGSSTQYIARSSYTSNGQIMDGLYPTTAETRVNAQMLPSGDTGYVSVMAGGYYIVGIISNSSEQAMGAVTYYQMTPEQLARLKSYMMSASFLSQQGLTVQTVVDVIPTELLKTLYNPFQYIASCEWFPFAFSSIPNSFKTLDVNVQFGWWMPETSSQIQGYRINANGYIGQIQNRYPVYGHPQRQDRGVYLDHSPFTDRMLYYVPFGSVPINDDSIIGGDYIRTNVQIDYVLGDAVLSVYHDRPAGGDSFTNMGLISRSSSKLSVPIQLAQTTVDLEGTLNAMPIAGIGNIAQGLIAGKGIMGSLMDGVDGVIDTVTQPVAQLQTAGANGSLAQYANQSYWIQKWRIVADDDNSQHGRPLYAMRQISNVPGYIMCANAEIALSCFEAERTRIINYLNSGFFYE